MRYYDTSAIVKRYVDEPGSPDVRRLMILDAPPVTSAASGAEAAAAIAAAVRDGRLSRDQGEGVLATFWADWDDGYNIITLNGPLGRRAGELAWIVGLRGYDSVHLATAIAAAQYAGEALVLVTYDRQMQRVAHRIGVMTYPNDLEVFYTAQNH